MNDKDVTSTSEWVTPCGCHCGDRYVGYRRKVIMKALYFALLSGVEYSSVGLGVKFTPGFFSIIGRSDLVDIDCFQPLD